MSGKNKIAKKHLAAFGIILFLCVLVNFTAKAALPKIYAVVIGISRYQQNSLNDIQYADRDAEAFADFLRSSNCGNTPSDQVALLVNENATRANVLNAVQNFSSLASGKDVLIIYFAGHGTNATFNNNFYLETYNTDPRHVIATATSADDVKNILNASMAKMIFWITDACNSGKISSGRIARRGSSSGPSEAEKFLGAIAKERTGGFVYLASSQSQETTIEGEQYGGGHGIFTYYLLLGLKGQAEADNNGIITINACYDYLRLQVIKQSDGYQHPVLGDLYFNGKFPMSCIGNPNTLDHMRNDFSKPHLQLPPRQPQSMPYFDQTTNVNSHLNTHINVRKGELVQITAAGTINVGPFVGDSGPDGRESGLLGFPLAKYNIVREFRHAVLMFKLNEADNWVVCGANVKFRSAKDGELIFQVNDNDQGNNSGAYKVEIQKFQ